MAITWSAASGGMYIGIEAWVKSGPDASGRVVVRVDYFLEAASGWTHSWSYPWHWSGTGGSGSQTVRYVSGNAFAPVRHQLPGWDVPVQAEYGRTSYASFSASVGPIWNGGAPSVSVNVPIPARAYDGPASPSVVSASRVSDTQVSVSWQIASSVSAPVQKIFVERKSATDEVWRQVASLEALARSWSDAGVEPNNRYQYRVYGVSSVAGGKRESSPVATTPAAAVNVRAVKDASGNIQVSWDTAAPYAASGWSVYDQDQLVTRTHAATTQFTHTGADQYAPHSYRVVMHTDNGLASLKSAASNVVHVLAPPNAPALVSPTGFTASGPVVFEWVHNPQDSTPQTGGRIQYRKQGADAWTVKTTGALQTASVDLTAGVYQWQVQTRGLHADWSPWSALGVCEVVDAPQVAITTPANTVNGSALTVAWSYFQRQNANLVLTEIELYNTADESEILEAVRVSGTANEKTLTTVLEDKASYRVRLRCRSAHGLWSPWADSVFRVSFPSPPVPVVDVVWDENKGHAVLTVRNPMPLDPVAFQRVNVVKNGRGAHVKPGFVVARRNLAHDPHGKNPIPAGRLGIKEGGAGNGGQTSTVRHSGGVPGLVGGVSGYVEKTWTRIGSNLENVGFGFAHSATASGFPVMPGQTLAVSVWVRASRSVACVQGARLALATVNAAGKVLSSWLYSSDVVGELVGGVWQRFTGVFTIPQNVAYVAPLLQMSLDPENWGVGDALACTGLLVEETGIVGEFFSGDHAPDPDFTTGWEGTPYASQSVLKGKVPVGWVVNGTGRAFTTQDGIQLSGQSAHLAASLDLTGARPGDAVAVAFTAHTTTKEGACLSEEARLTANGQTLATIIPTDLEVSPVPSLYVAHTILESPATSATLVLPTTQTGAPIYYDKIIATHHVSPDHALDTVRAYFDGDTPDNTMLGGQSHTTAWAGRKGESVSVATPNSPAPVFNQIERSINNTGTWETLTTRAPLDATIYDPECLSHGTTYYRVTTHSALPSATTSTHTLTTRSPAIWINAGNGYTRGFALRRKLKINATSGLAFQSGHMFQGRNTPVFYDSHHTTRALNVTALVLPMRAETRKEDAAEHLQGKVDEVSTTSGGKLWRDYTGRRVYGRLTHTAFNHSINGLAEVSLTFEEGQ